MTDNIHNPAGYKCSRLLRLCRQDNLLSEARQFYCPLEKQTGTGLACLILIWTRTCVEITSSDHTNNDSTSYSRTVRIDSEPRTIAEIFNTMT